MVAGTGMAIVWTSLGLWAAGVRQPDKVLLGVALSLLLPSAGVRVNRLLKPTSPSSPSSSSPSSPLPLPTPLPEDHGD